MNNIKWIPKQDCIALIVYHKEITVQEANNLWMRHAQAYGFIDKMPAVHLDAIIKLGDFISNIDYGKE